MLKFLSASFFERLVWVVVLGILIRALVVTNYRVTDNRMLPMFMGGDQVLVYHLPFTLASLSFDKKRWLQRSLPVRGQSIVMQNRNKKSSVALARVIGLPGDRVDFVQGKLTLNGKRVRQVPVRSLTADSGSWQAQTLSHPHLAFAWNILLPRQANWSQRKQEYVVAQGHVLVMQDNWVEIGEKQLFFEIKFEQIVGTVQAISLSLHPDQESIQAAMRWERSFRLVD